MNAAMRDYYERRAAEYDDWWLGTGLFAERDRPGWHEDRETLIEALRGLAPKRTLDLARGKELVVVDAAQRPGQPAEDWQERTLNDGSKHSVYKRWFTPESLMEELGTGAIVHAGSWLIALLIRQPDPL